MDTLCTNKVAASIPKIKCNHNHYNYIFSKMILNCESCIVNWIFPTVFDCLLFIPGPRPLNVDWDMLLFPQYQFDTFISLERLAKAWMQYLCFYTVSKFFPVQNLLFRKMNKYTMCDVELIPHLLQECDKWFSIFIVSNKFYLWYLLENVLIFDFNTDVIWLKCSWSGVKPKTFYVCQMGR